MNDIKIGFIAHSINLEVIHQVLFDFPNINGVFLDGNIDIYSESFTASLAEVEGLVVSDFYTYHQLLRNNSIHIPIHCIPITTMSVYEAMLNIQSHYPCDLLSIDSCHPSIQMNISKTQLFNKFKFEYIPTHINSLDDIINQHIHNVNDSNATVLTTYLQVHKHMVNLKIPSELVIASHADIVNTIERALLSTKSRIACETQSAVCTVSFLSKLRKQRFSILKIRELISSLTKALKGYYYETEDGFNIVTNRGFTETYTQGYKQFPFFDMCTSMNITDVYAGIGFSDTVDLAHKNAERALQQSLSKDTSCCYIVRSDLTTFGPLSQSTMPSNEKYATTITDESLLNLSSKTGMSATYLNKLFDKLSKASIRDFTALDIAELSGISLRSANRILLKCTDADIIEVVGEQKISNKGRPRRIYRFKT